MSDETQTKPTWLPDTQGFLAIAIIFLIAVVVLILLTRPPAIDERTSGVLMTIVGVLIACLKDVYSFFFGSSKGSDSKTDTQNKIMEKLTSAPPNGPVAPVPSPAAAPIETAWWNRLTTDERTAITAASVADPGDAKLATIATGPMKMKPDPDEIAYLVTKSLLTQSRATEIQA